MPALPHWGEPSRYWGGGISRRGGGVAIYNRNRRFLTDGKGLLTCSMYSKGRIQITRLPALFAFVHVTSSPISRGLAMRSNIHPVLLCLVLLSPAVVQITTAGCVVRDIVCYKDGVGPHPSPDPQAQRILGSTNQNHHSVLSNEYCAQICHDQVPFALSSVPLPSVICSLLPASLPSRDAWDPLPRRKNCDQPLWNPPPKACAAAAPVFWSRTWGFEACRSTKNFAWFMVIDNCLSALSALSALFAWETFCLTHISQVLYHVLCHD